MRLIDDDKLWRTITTQIEEYCDLADLIEIIEKQPAVDAEPVRHGKWVDDKGLYRCSVCNNLWTHWWIVACPEDRMYKEMKFCPNCGAKMEKENEPN